MSDAPRSLIDRVGLLRPLRIHDFRLLWIGATVSLIGDGIYVVAMALQVLQLENRAGTLAKVGIAWTVPQVVLVLVSGALSDRLDRRHLMIAGDLIRLAAISAIGVLSVLDGLTVPVLIALVVVFGVGQALFNPAFTSIIPSIVPEELLVEANALGQFVRPACLLVVGPLVGGVLAGTFGPGWAFLVDGASFVWSAAMVWRMRIRREGTAETTAGAVWADMKEGLRYVVSTRWLTVAMFGATLSLLVVWGPWEALVPFVVRNDLVGNPGQAGLAIGLVIGAGGVGSVVAAAFMGQRGTLPNKPILILYLSWAFGMFAIAGFGIVTSVWQAMVVSFFAEGAIGVLIVIWFTLLQRLVPRQLLGRVSALDWMITIAGVPLSFAIVGPLADRIGADATLIWAGVVGGLLTLSFLLIPGVRDPERDGSLAEPDVDPTGPLQAGG
jgi:MFS family permease